MVGRAVLALLITCVCYGNCMKITKLSVTNPVTVGGSAQLGCDWSAARGNGDSSDDLSSLKWYFGKEEFYRWIPKTHDNVKIFKLIDQPFEVNKEMSSGGCITIENIKIQAAFQEFSCEVTGEAPFFSNDIKKTSLNVYDIPNSDPVIIGEEEFYERHQPVRLECSLGGFPAPNLTFYINNHRARDDWIHTHIQVISSTHHVSILNLNFPLNPRFLINDVAVVTCKAVIHDIFWATSEVKIGLYPHHGPYPSASISGAAQGGILTLTSENMYLLFFIIILILKSIFL